MSPFHPHLADLIAQHVPEAPQRVLEIGCGKGMNGAIFQERGDHYRGIDKKLRCGSLNGMFLEGDFTKELPEGPFDLIIDRAGLTYCTPEEIENALALAWKALTPEGMMIASEFYGEGHKEIDKPTDWGSAKAFTAAQLGELFRFFARVDVHEYQTHRGPFFDVIARKL